jgi:hypothetical protein
MSTASQSPEFYFTHLPIQVPKSFSLEEDTLSQSAVRQIIKVEMVSTQKVKAKSEKTNKLKQALSDIKISTFANQPDPFDIFEFKESVVYKSIE